MTWTLILDILFLFRKQMCMFPSLPKGVMVYKKKKKKQKKGVKIENVTK